MGDVSAEPSMEDILSSIKRIIAEEGDAVAANARSTRRTPKAVSTTPRADPAFDDDDEVLELSDAVPEAASAPLPISRAGTVLEDEEDQAMSSTAPAEPSEAILSPRTAEASRGALEALSRLIVKPSEAGADTLEGLVREMIRPMLREWLDARLPVIVETMVAQEIARITKHS